MSQSRFSIVLVGVSALLRRPLVSRLRPAVFAARGSGGFRRSALPSASGLPLGELTFGLTASAFLHAPLRGCPRRVGASAFRFGVAARRVGSSAFRFGDCPRRVGLRAHDFRFSACAASELPSASWFFRLPLRRLPLGGLGFGLTLRGCPRRVGLRAHGFRFSARTDPHRLTAEARADGAHRHDTCFTSKHLSQHVNLPHRSP